MAADSSKRARASFVAQAMCGVTMQFFACSSGLSRGWRLAGKNINGRACQAAVVERVCEVLLD